MFIFCIFSASIIFNSTLMFCHMDKMYLKGTGKISCASLKPQIPPHLRIYDNSLMVYKN